MRRSRCGVRRVLLLCGLAVSVAGSASAQTIGTFRWQLSPYCNVITLTVTQVAGLYRLEGYDDQCLAAGPRAATVGLAVPNPNGTIGFGLTVVSAPGATPSHLDVTLNLSTLGGTWRDHGGTIGVLVYNPAGSGGPARPTPTVPVPDGSVTTAKLAPGAVDGSRVLDGSIGAVDVNAAQVQWRVAGACASGQFVQAVNQNGTVACGADGTGTGDITGVAAGAGLSGGGTAGDVALAVSFGGSGSAGTAARSDHAHAGMGDITSVIAGAGIAGGAAAGDATVSVAFAGPGAAASAARSDHTHAISASSLAVGPDALQANSASANNTAVGKDAIRYATTGSENTAVGSESMWLAEGSGNTAVGRSAMRHLAGTYNTAVGANTLQFIQGNGNIGIGWYAGDWTSSGNDNIYIGHPGRPGFGAESNRIRIGFAHQATFIQGIRGVTTGVADAVPVVVDSQGQLGTVSSSQRFKEDIAPLGAVAAGVQRLRPVQFRYTQPFADGAKPVQYGLIAEEVAEVYPELVARSANGEIETVKYHVLPTLLLAEVQRLERERQRLAGELEALRSVVEALRQERR